MKCFVCGSRLTDDDYCPKCRQDVKLYKKIIFTSNAYYNIGLSKARVRDLSGAAAHLRNCLKFNKYHIDARNLLGLVYFEMGESGEALHEWLISKYLKEEHNPADHYIRKIQSNQNKYDALCQSIHKYNISLKYLEQDGIDLAVIQLKKVIATNPKLIRAYLLLSLVYIKKENYKKAEKLLVKCLEIDRNNATAQHYLDEIGEITGDHDKLELARDASIKQSIINARKKDDEESTENDEEGTEEVYIQKRRINWNSYFMNAWVLILGVAIGIGLLYNFVMPSKKNEYQAKAQSQVREIEGRIAEADAKSADLKDELELVKASYESLKQEYEEKETDTAEAETEDDKEDNTKAETKSDTKDEEGISYALDMMDAFGQGDVNRVSELMDKASGDIKKSKEYKKTYDFITVDNHDKFIDLFLNQGRDRYNANDFEAAISLLTSGLKYTDDKNRNDEEKIPEMMLMLALSYHRSAKPDEARALYDAIIEDYPNTAWAAQATVHRGNL